MPSATIGYQGHSATISWPDGTPDADVQAQIRGVQAHMTSLYGAAPGDSSFGADLQAGAHQLMDNTGAAAQGIGSALNDAGLTTPGGLAQSGGTWLRNSAPAVPTNYAPRGGNVLSDLGQGNFLTAAGDLAHGAVEAAPVMGAGLAAGAATTALGIGPEAGAALVGGVTELGAGAEARANAAGRQMPNTADTVGAIPRAAIGAGAQAIGFGRLASTPLRQVLAAGADNALMNTSDQIDNSVTSGKGVSFSPTEAANAALSGAAFGGATQVPGLARSAIGAVARPAVASLLGDAPATDAQAMSSDRVGRVTDNAAARLKAQTGKDPSPLVVMNTAKADIVSALNRRAQSMFQQGVLDRDQFVLANQIINKQALPHNNSVSSGSDGASMFDRLANSGVNADAMKPLLDGIQDLNTISTGSFANAQVGLLQSAGRIAGKYGPAAVALSHGNVLGAGLGLLAGKYEGNLGAKIGAIGDNILGTSMPKQAANRVLAQRYLASRGLTAGPDTLTSLQNAQAAATDAQPAISAAQAAATNGGQDATNAFYDAAERDQGTVDKAQQQRDALRQTQIDQAFAANARQRQAQQQQTEAAYAQGGPPGSQGAPGVPPEIAAYLAAKLADPSLLPATSGMSQAAEMALQSDRLRNAGVVAKNRANAQKVLDQAASGTVGAMAQAKLDKAARRNEIALQAAQLTPADPLAGDTASAAAARAAGDRAASIARMAPNASSSADRAAIGLPPDPVPVGVPVGATVGPSRPPQPASAPLPTLVPNTASDVANTMAADGPAPQAPPGAPQAAPQAPQQVPGGGSTGPAPRGIRRPSWSAYVSHGNVAITHEAAVAAANAAEAAGAVPAGTAAFLATHSGTANPAILGPIQRIAYANAAGEGVGIPTAGPVRDPIRYATSTQGHIANAENAAQAAERAGLPTTGAAIRAVGATRGPDRASTRIAKLAVWNAHLDSLPPEARALAAQMMPVTILNHGPER